MAAFVVCPSQTPVPSAYSGSDSGPSFDLHLRLMFPPDGRKDQDAGHCSWVALKRCSLALELQWALSLCRQAQTVAQWFPAPSYS